MNNIIKIYKLIILKRSILNPTIKQTYIKNETKELIKGSTKPFKFITINRR